MASYRPTYSYDNTNGPALNRNRSLFSLVAFLVFVAISFVAFLTLGESISLKYTFKPSEAPRLILDVAVIPTTANMNAQPPQEGLDDFLARTKTFALDRLPAKSGKHVTLIMGNEAGDLDSAASAIVLSFLLTHLGSPTGFSLPESVYIPLIQTNHEDAALRPENTAAFRSAGINTENLLWLDDLSRLGFAFDSSAFSPASGVSIGLVDHPSLTGPWGGAMATDRRVDIVVDHHEDANDHADAKLRIIKSPSKEPVGSATSLIAGLFKDRLQQGAVPRQVADLLLSTIIVDTDNLGPTPRGKATQTDFDAINLLLPISSFSDPEASGRVEHVAFLNSPLNATKPSEPTVDPLPASSPFENLDAKAILRTYYEILSKSKMMVSHLSGRDLLRRDYKELNFTDPEHSSPNKAKLALKLGFSSVPLSIAEWLHKDRPKPSLADVDDAKAEVEQAWSAWWKVLDSFMEERKLDIAVLTGSFRVPEGQVDAGKHKRELMLAYAPRNLAEPKAASLWDDLRQGLEADAHVSADEVDRKLMLEEPWKGQRLPIRAGGKRERVKGVDKDGKRAEAAGKLRWAKVYKQANSRANRKIVLPAVVHVLRTAAAKL